MSICVVKWLVPCYFWYHRNIKIAVSLETGTKTGIRDRDRSREIAL